MAVPTTTLDFSMDKIAALCAEYQVRELSLFGSALRDDLRPDSDLDFLVVFEPEASIGFLELAALQRKLGNALQRRVDLVPKNGLKPLIRDQILASSRVIYDTE